MTFDIKRVGRTDEALFDCIAPDVFDEDIHDDWLSSYLADPFHMMVVAMCDGEIVGQAAAVIHRHPNRPAELYIDNLGVTPACQRQGIGRRLIDDLIAWGREQGCNGVWLGTEADNAAARALYSTYAKPEPIVVYYWEL